MPNFGDYRPDLPEHGHGHLVHCSNVYPGPLGYQPMKVPVEFTAALLATWKGGGSFSGTGGNQSLIGATTAALYKYSSGAWTSAYTVATTGNWHFTQFGDLVIGTHGGVPVKYTLTTSAGAALGGTPPSASYCTVVRDQVFLAGDSGNTKRVTWSAINDAEGWTVGTNQCDQQDIPDHGDITGLAGGEFGLVFQRDAINLFEYVGPPTIYTRRKVSDAIGCMAHGSIAQAGKMVFFLSPRGFYMFNEGQLVAIGRDKVDQTFFGMYPAAEIENSIRATVDPDRQLVIWSMPGRLWIYNWELEKWSHSDQSDLIAISSGATASVTLEDIAVTYPSIENVTPVLDDPIWNGGKPILLVVKSDNKLYSFGSNTNMEAQLTLPKGEAYPNRRAHVRRARLQSDATAVIFDIFHSERLGDTQLNSTSYTIRDNGDIPIRVNGRFLQARVTIPQGEDWSYLQGLELEATKGGWQ